MDTDWFASTGSLSRSLFSVLWNSSATSVACVALIIHCDASVMVRKYRCNCLVFSVKTHADYYLVLFCSQRRRNRHIINKPVRNYSSFRIQIFKFQCRQGNEKAFETLCKETTGSTQTFLISYFLDLVTKAPS